MTVRAVQGNKCKGDKDGDDGWGDKEGKKVVVQVLFSNTPARVVRVVRMARVGRVISVVRAGRAVRVV